MSGDATAVASAIIGAGSAGEGAKPAEAPAGGAAKPAGTAPAAAKPGEKPAEKAPEAKPPKASDFASLAARTKAVENQTKKEREELATARAAWEKEKGDALKNASDSALTAFRERIKKGEFDEALAEIGVDYVSWSKARLAKMGKAGAPNAATQQPQDVAKLVTEELARRDEASKKEAETSAEKAWSDSWSPIAEELAAKPAGYELLSDELTRYPGEVESVFKEMARRQPGISAKDAADKYEAYLLDRQRQLMQIGKVKALFAPETKQAEKAIPGAGAGQKANEGGPRTLTNADAAEPSGGPGGASSRPLTRPEQIALDRAEEKRRDTAATGRLT